jgi:hypothetical protein
MNDILAAVEAWTPPFFFHYIIVILCIAFIMCVAVLKFKYLYWYNQPLTFRFTLRRFGSGGGGGGGRPTSIMNPLSLGERCYNAVVYPFLNYVNHIDVKVFNASADDGAEAVLIRRFERIAAFLSRPETEIVTPARIGASRYIEGGCIPCDTLRIILSQPTFGLSPFIGLLRGTQTGSVDVAAAAIPIKGVSVVTPRIMMSFDGGRRAAAAAAHSVSIYMCDYLAWERYTTSDRESLELLETTEYIQKSREIAGEQTLYRYREIPWFVIPFTTVYTYTFRMPALAAAPLGNGMSVVRVSSVNMALFYSFVNECSRDFRCCIFNEFTQLQSLVTHGIYRIYMLLFNQVRVVAAYIFAPSWMKTATATATAATNTRNKHAVTTTTTTKANRISELHEYISNTSTALVKYIPPVITPQYDAFGKRVSRTAAAATTTARAAARQRTSDESILLLMSSIQHRSLCENTDFVAGFYSAATAAAAATTASAHHMKTNPNIVMIDTIAHNYRLIDDITAGTTTPTLPSIAWELLSRDKWYYILYNAIIHEQTVCKDILMI